MRRERVIRLAKPQSSGAGLQTKRKSDPGPKEGLGKPIIQALEIKPLGKLVSAGKSLSLDSQSEDDSDTGIRTISVFRPVAKPQSPRARSPTEPKLDHGSKAGKRKRIIQASKIKPLETSVSAKRPPSPSSQSDDGSGRDVRTVRVIQVAPKPRPQPRSQKAGSQRQQTTDSESEEKVRKPTMCRPTNITVKHVRPVKTSI